MMCVYMCHSYMCHIICVHNICRILFHLIYYIPAYMGIYSPPCIIDGVVYVYYMCMYIILYVCSWAKEINFIYVYYMPSYSDI